MARIIFLIFLHVAGDFLFQGSKMRRLKTSNLSYLFTHVGIYLAVFIVLSPLLLGLTFVQGLFFSVLNAVIHFIVDYFTGHLKSKYREIDEKKYALVGIFDQIIHIAVLIALYLYLYPDALTSLNY